jgi:hypothetical protein
MLWWNAPMRADTAAGARRSDRGMAAVKIDRFNVEAMGAVTSLARCIWRANVVTGGHATRSAEKC